MEDMIVVKDLSYQYDENDRLIFDHLSFTVPKGHFTTLAGPVGSGKSTLVKLLLGLRRTSQYIKIGDLILNSENRNEIRKKIGVAFEHPDDLFVAETVMDEIAFALENMNLGKKEIWTRVHKVSEQLGIGPLLEKNPHQLSGGEKQLVSLASAMVIQPELIILDEALTMIDAMEKRRILEILKMMKETEKITILNITHDLDESLYGDDILILQDGKMILNGPKEVILKEEKRLKQAGLELPFLVDLSIRLQYYGILDHMILDMNEMVNAIWK